MSTTLTFVCRWNGAGKPSTCVQTCQSVGECVASTETKGAFDRDNYECRNGDCVYLGCKSDAECAATLSSTNYRCHKAFEGGYPYCYFAECTTATDCANGQTVGAYDADNWTCGESGCEWLGCKNDGECAATFQGSGKSYVCTTPAK